ncbi:hypothetical protein GCM10011494_36880 [Novosphingobium endophyticum]|uniref:Uncharacterized protein n=1 Tax=Novosphingobium endophyticum TaxID=1955250 RepID=A0A916X766_9SPHN|nr:hypothetical protein [Novosphingobium endophyticum]GGC14672.1 hypothetical protein GCM10011494_36880 [Novosphingobium endophyticum]
MAVTLLHVDEHVSLEFGTEDLSAIRDYIGREYPDAKCESAGIVAVVSFGDEAFIFQNEWDAPCLISNSMRGDELLRNVHTHFNQR